MDIAAAPETLTTTTVSPDDLWYKDAIIYQLHIKSFFDANNDGIGDFPGRHQAALRIHRGESRLRGGQALRRGRRLRAAGRVRLHH